MTIHWLKLIGSIIICQLAGILGSIFTITAVNSWYDSLTKPAFNPPNEVFGPVWTILYILMGISLYLIWTNKAKHKKPQYITFYTQLILNFLWSIFFFGLQSPLLGGIDIILLNIAILTTIVLFWKVSKPASYLLIPYLCWTLFATVLNISIIILN